MKESLTMYEVLDILQDDHRSFEKKIADLNREKKIANSSRRTDSELSSDDTTLD